ncbi:MAG: pyridoxal 5'-phosphate synthase glutaminase subunit PdxT [Nitriliruptorales bacterium]|nr:pyridoxal 5'-phosphate synthase glutaminase subunit PdxT [Nitriliruptorales bacterium]
MGVLGLQGDVLEHVRALGRVGARARIVRREDDLDGLDGIVIPGGESTTIGKLLERFDLLGPLRKTIHDGLPALGTCAGMILLASDIEGSDQPRLGLVDIAVRRNAFGTQVDSFDTDLVIPSIEGGPVSVSFIRAPIVTRTGDQVEILAKVDLGPVLVRQAHIVAAAFHPEVAADDRVHRWFLDDIVSRVAQ